MICRLLASRICEYLGNNATDSGEIAKYAGGISVLTQTFRRNKYVGGNVRYIDNQKEAAKIGIRVLKKIQALTPLTLLAMTRGESFHYRQPTVICMPPGAEGYRCLGTFEEMERCLLV